MDFGSPGGTGRPRGQPGPDRTTSSILLGLGGPGRPRNQPDPNHATFSILEVWAAPGGSEASRTPTKRHQRFWVSGRPPAAQWPAGHRPSDIFDFGGLGGPGRPRPTGPRAKHIFDFGASGRPLAAQKPAGPRPGDVFNLGRLKAAGGPGQQGPDQTTPSILGIWAGPGGPEASRTPTERHLRIWVSGRPRAAQKPAGPRPSDIFDLGVWAAPGGSGRPDPDQATSSI